MNPSQLQKQFFGVIFWTQMRTLLPVTHSFQAVNPDIVTSEAEVSRWVVEERWPSKWHAEEAGRVEIHQLYPLGTNNQISLATLLTNIPANTSKLNATDLKPDPWRAWCNASSSKEWTEISVHCLLGVWDRGGWDERPWKPSGASRGTVCQLHVYLTQHCPS